MADNQFDPDIYEKPDKLMVVLEVYKTHSELLKAMTQIDLRIMGGYITIHIVSAGFILSHNGNFGGWALFGIVTMSTAVFIIAYKFIALSFIRRGEAARIIKNTNVALGLREEGLFLRKKRLHFYLADTKDTEYKRRMRRMRRMLRRMRHMLRRIFKPTPAHRPWRNYYQFGIIVGWLSLLLITFSKT